MVDPERPGEERGGKVVDFFTAAKGRRETPDVSLQGAQTRLDDYGRAQEASPWDPSSQSLLVSATTLFLDGVKKVHTGEHTERVAELAEALLAAMRPWNLRRGETSIELMRAYAEVGAYRMRDTREVAGAARRLEEMGKGDPVVSAAARRILSLVDSADDLPPTLAREVEPHR